MFIVTLTALPMAGVGRARLTVTPGEGAGVTLDVKAGAFASAPLLLAEGTTFAFKMTLQLDAYPISSARAENVPSDGGFHVQVIGPSQPSGRPSGVGHIAHLMAQGQVAIELVCDGPPPHRQSCPGSLTCDDITLTC